MRLATLAYNGEKYSSNVEEALGEDGLNYSNIKEYKDTTENAESGSPCYIAHKKIKLNGNETELLLVVVRGTLNREWVNDFDTGDGLSHNVHEGFKSGADLVYNNIKTQSITFV